MHPMTDLPRRRNLHFAKLGVPLVLALSVIVASVAAPIAPAEAAGSPRRNVIVRFVPGTDVTTEAAGLTARGGRVNHVYRNAISGVAVNLPEAAISALARNPKVAMVEPDAVVTTTNTIQSGATWGLDRIDQTALPLNGTYSYTTNAAGVSVYIVDTGVRASHVDFAGRVASGTNAYTGVADGRGTDDCTGHGTHVASIAAGSRYGVAKGATIHPVRVVDCTSASTVSQVIAGLDWVVAHHVAGVPAVANISLSSAASASFDAAVRRVIADGVTVVVAAGNANANACNTSPSRVTEALTVAASTSVDARATFSSWGPCVDLFAPGATITAAAHTSDTAIINRSGTSMAAPHVVGVAALRLAENPTASPATVHDNINTTATAGVITSTMDSPNRLVFSRSIAVPVVTAPAAPATPVVTLGNAQCTVSWVAPIDGGSVITSYTLQQNQGAGVWSTVYTGPNLTHASVGLTNGSSYTYRVLATNTVGDGAFSTESAACAPRTTPDSPTTVGGVAGIRQVSLSWVTPVSDGGSAITDYAVQVSSNGGGTWTTFTDGTSTATSAMVTGLTNNTAYIFRVAAVSVVGAGGYSATSPAVTTFNVPTAPVAPRATAARRAVTVAWAAPANGGSPITGYTVRVHRASNGAVVRTVTVNAATLRSTVSGLNGGVAYYATVSATNAVGASTVSPRSNTVTALR